MAPMDRRARPDQVCNFELSDLQRSKLSLFLSPFLFASETSSCSSLDSAVASESSFERAVHTGHWLGE